VLLKYRGLAGCHLCIGFEILSGRLLLKGEKECWWCTPVFPALRRVRQGDCEFEASLGYIARPCLQKKSKRIDNGSMCGRISILMCRGYSLILTMLEKLYQVLQEQKLMCSHHLVMFLICKP
jgi:hypothetical protein